MTLDWPWYVRGDFRLLGYPSFVVIVLVSVVVGSIGCTTSSGIGKSQVDLPDGEILQVMASTALIAEFASRVAGSDANVDTLIPDGVDIHGYQPPTDVVRSISSAHLLLVNGFRLEEALLDVIIANRSDDSTTVIVSRGIPTLESAESSHIHHDQDQDRDGDSLMFSEGDPHLWMDVRNAIFYVENIRAALIEIDPMHAPGYRERADAYVAELEDLDFWVRETVSDIAQHRRQIVVFHDAFQYFARAYGFQLMATVLPVSPTQQLSAGALVDVIRTVKQQGLPAVYMEPQFGGQTMDIVARETGARVLPLYSTLALDVQTYEELIRANVSALVEGLGS